MFGLSLGSGKTEIIMLISSARLGLELSLARSLRHFFAQTLAYLWFSLALRFLIDPKQVHTYSVACILVTSMHISHNYFLSSVYRLLAKNSSSLVASAHSSLI